MRRKISYIIAGTVGYFLVFGSVIGILAGSIDLFGLIINWVVGFPLIFLSRRIERRYNELQNEAFEQQESSE